MASIGLEHAPVVDAKRSVLVFLARDAIADNQEVDVGSHKAAERVFRGADDRLASDIEAGVHQSRAAGARLEGGEQRVITRVCLFVNCLDTRRHVDMSNSRDFRADGVESVDPKKLFVFVRHRVTPILKDVGNDEHVRAVAIDLEPLGHVFP